LFPFSSSSSSFFIFLFFYFVFSNYLFIIIKKPKKKTSFTSLLPGVPSNFADMTTFGSYGFPAS